VKSYASRVIDAPVSVVWDLISEFDGWWRWHPAIVRGWVESGQDPRAVGAFRTQELSNGGVAHAVLVAMDLGDRSLRYEMLDGPWPVRNYVASVRLRPITADGRTFAEWWGEFDVDEADAARVGEDFRSNVYDGGLVALAEFVESR
jgi:hypothetical protein